MLVDSKTYWRERAELRSNIQHAKADKLVKDLKKQYEKALRGIDARIKILYIQFAKDNSLSYSEAVEVLKRSEFKEWRMSLEDYVAKIDATGDLGLKAELDQLAMNSRISRLDSLMFEIDASLRSLARLSEDKLKDHLGDVFDESYFRTLFDIQNVSKYAPVMPVAERELADLMEYPWSGANFSERIWKNTDKLKDDLKQTLIQKMVQGSDIRSVSADIGLRMEAAYFRAEALVRTETAYFMGEAVAKGYEDDGIAEYEILATLDTRTSEICQKQDGKKYKLDDRAVGVNYPPFHVRCRTDSVPFFDDLEMLQRAARDKDGKTILVPGDMKYEDWKDKYVKQK